MKNGDLSAATDKRAELDARLAALHLNGPPQDRAAAYEDAASAMDDPKAARFHLTHAYVFALEAGDELTASRLKSQLADLGGF